MHRMHVIDPGTEVTEGSGACGVVRVFRWGLRCPFSGKVTTYLQGSNTVVLSPTPDFRHLVRRLSNRYCPQAYLTAVSHPTSTSRLWIVGIASVGTESVGIAWCTPHIMYYTHGEILLRCIEFIMSLCFCVLLWQLLPHYSVDLRA